MRGGLRRTSGHALWMIGVVVALSSLWRGGMEILLDVTGNAAHDALGGVLGRTGEWLILAGVLAGWAVYIRRKHPIRCTPRGRRRVVCHALPVRSVRSRGLIRHRPSWARRLRAV